MAKILNTNLREDGTELTQDSYRKPYETARAWYEDVFSKMIDDQYSNDLVEQRQELEKEKVKFRDERNELNRVLREQARREFKLDKLEEGISFQGKVNFEIHENLDINSDNDLLVILSDLHIGQCFDSNFGKYNSDIAIERLNQYLNEIISISKLHNSEKCYVSLQGDIISNSIHKSLAITNRENVIEQIKLATELISSFCYELTKYFSKVFLQNVSGNHSRIDKKDDALHDERLDDLISWNVELSLKHIDNFTMLKRNIDIGISDLNIRGKTYIGVHGDYDSFSKQGIANLVLMIGFVPYAVTFGHLHTCAVNESSGVKMIRGGSLAGSGDSYTIEKRLNGKPSQMVCVCDNRGVKAYYSIELN